MSASATKSKSVDVGCLNKMVTGDYFLKVETQNYVCSYFMFMLIQFQLPIFTQFSINLNRLFAESQILVYRNCEKCISNNDSWYLITKLLKSA